MSSTPASESVLNVATLQPELRQDAVSNNVHRIRLEVESLRSAGPLDLVLLPEYFDGRTGLDVEPDVGCGQDAERFLQTLARTCNVHVIGGSVVVPDGEQTVNRCYVVERGGRIVGHYDKRQLFSTELDCRKAGGGVGVFTLGAARVGVLICADLWWPELVRELVGRVDLICVPARTGVRSREHAEYARALWGSLALTRAMENGVVVLVSDWAGSTQDDRVAGGDGPSRWKHATAGAATICDPSHRPDMTRIQRNLPTSRPGALRAEIDLVALEKYRDYRRSVGLLPA